MVVEYGHGVGERDGSCQQHLSYEWHDINRRDDPRKHYQRRRRQSMDERGDPRIQQICHEQSGMGARWLAQKGCGGRLGRTIDNEDDEEDEDRRCRWC